MSKLSETRREQIEQLVETSFGGKTALCAKAHEIYQLVASHVPLVVMRGGEERRIVDNLALIGHINNTEVYDWSIATGLYRCKPSAQLSSKRIPEEISMSPQERQAAGVSGLGLLAYYLRDKWQHPMLGARPESNPTFGQNRTDIKQEQSRGSVFIIKDAHLFLSGPGNVLNLRQMKDLVEYVTWQQHTRVMAGERRDRSLKGMTIVLTAPLGWEIPAEIKQQVSSDMVFPSPTESEFKKLLYGSVLGNGSPTDARTRVESQEGRIIQAATGLQASSFMSAIKTSVVEQKLDRNSPFDIRDDIIASAKKAAIKAGGAISYEEPTWSMDDVGGHDALKRYLRDRSVFFDPENPIIDQLPAGVTLPMPKGVLMVGVPGCGKSLEAKAMASMLRVPLLTLDMGAVFTGIVGGSEQRIREAIQLAEDCAPCVMRIEEIEKALSGSGSSNMSDGGTTNRVFQTILNWLQEKESPVFVVATANDVRQLPPELLRKGRFDEIFFVDLPVEEEREAIFDIHLKKWAGLSEDQIKKNFDLKMLAGKCDNFSGAEIEALIKDSLYEAVSEWKRNGMKGKFAFTDKHVIATIGEGPEREFRILYDSEAERLDDLRAMARVSWANASDFEGEKLTTKQSDAAVAATISEDSMADDFFDSDLT
jgi:SpoVK/Ycf46/Vps4 family AAA+-type ATPase